MNSLFDCLSPTRKKQIRSIHVDFHNEKVVINLRFFNYAHTAYDLFDPPMKFTYAKERSYTPRDLQRIDDRKAYIVSENFVAICCSDLESLITQQNCLLDELLVTNQAPNNSSISEEVYTTLKNAMRFRSREIQVRKLKCCDTQIQLVIPLLDSKVLASVVVDSSIPIKNMKEFLKSEVWKPFEGLQINISIYNLNWRNLVFLKRSLLFSPIFSSICITFCHIQESYLFKHFGYFSEQNERLESHIHVWETKRDYVKVSLKKDSNQITFSRIKCDVDPSGFSSFFGVEDIVLEKVDIESAGIGSLGLRVLSNGVIMSKVTDHLDFRDFQVLRKASPPVRQCIDRLKPDPQLISIVIQLQSSQRTNIEMSFKNRDALKIRYEDTVHGCLVNEVSVDHKSHHQVLLQDLRTNLKYQSEPLKELRIDFQPNMIPTGGNIRFSEIIAMTASFFENFASVFPKDSLRVRKLNTVFINELCALGVLTKLGPEVLTTIELRTPILSGQLVMVPTSKLSYTKQWKHAKEIIMKECLNIAPAIYEFEHLARAEFVKDKMTDNDFYNYKTDLLDFPALVKFKIGIRRCHISKDIYNLFGPPYRLQNDQLAEKRDTWYFFVPSRLRALHVVYYKSQCVIFSCVKLDAVPDDAILNE